MNHSILIRQLTLHEGRKRFPYKDSVGKITIGVGRNLAGVGLSEDEIDYLLTNDVNKCIASLDSTFPWWRGLNEARQHVILDMCFNLGLAGLAKFILTLESIRVGNYAKASEQMMQSKWSTQVGQRAKRLSEMMRTGIFPLELT